MAIANQRPAPDSNGQNNNQQPKEANMKTIHPNELHGVYALTFISEDGEQHHIGNAILGNGTAELGAKSQAWSDCIDKLAASMHKEPFDAEAAWNELSPEEQARQTAEVEAAERFVEKYGPGEGDDVMANDPELEIELYGDYQGRCRADYNPNNQ